MEYILYVNGIRPYLRNRVLVRVDFEFAFGSSFSSFAFDNGRKVILSFREQYTSFTRKATLFSPIPGLETMDPRYYEQDDDYQNNNPQTTQRFHQQAPTKKVNPRCPPIDMEFMWYVI
jgi:hypothetical protein